MEEIIREFLSNQNPFIYGTFPLRFVGMGLQNMNVWPKLTIYFTRCLLDEECELLSKRLKLFFGESFDSHYYSCYRDFVDIIFDYGEFMMNRRNDKIDKILM